MSCLCIWAIFNSADGTKENPDYRHGIKLHKRDYKNNSFANPKENVISYTNEDKWFRYLRASYLKFWGKESN